ncbi:type II toxin-antitoxin system PemK/MazF family toxin [Endozoicomonas sp. SCSIO W0465]|uniref:type II toxin-antitoxin system PemK/MazF family toxin n=1 Tax=Endozoicomonas sp. SCSIO W0465 TaxID=2918516 RepID=UPI0020760692|nr:type II toxin-antitoxin system PemK/MazF family toxin [Endozoicomonas sp. SCSIO W0465]USE38674.1 type II toxin-antitoxin system PemK/MazF family toxin [Endozoicomonas sp. SCSIO W0465]
MEVPESGLAAGIVVAIKFPFSDLSRAKLRPALVLADAGKGDFVLCQITSKSYADTLAVTIETDDFVTGLLPLTSFARPGKLFTAHGSLIEKALGAIKPEKHAQVVESVCNLLRNN